MLKVLNPLAKMTKPNKISLNAQKGTFLAVVFCIVASMNAFAQVEQERNIPELPKTIDHSGSFESPESGTVDQRSDNFYRPSPAKNKPQVLNAAPQRKENPILKQGGEKENRKEGMSTLSFNLFLYVVDKFKED
ncbi:hypothetical protein P872_05385 [Rhodonellum psychrophilum GCM71 = DSM 17998]|uniref:Uncharacterized protein n=2 Tax=Cytophagaceae TaxID=89373 RepID=U5C3Y3_9BACT|nr:hypothetical protein P872_05385 [Rhodonellum psychrophilum GCM71 = DSM 17998]